MSLATAAADRQLVVALISLLVLLGIAVILQGSGFGDLDDATMPSWVRRRLRYAELFGAAVAVPLTLVGVTVGVVAIHESDVTPTTLSILGVAAGGMYAWAALLAVGRRVLRNHWRPARAPHLAPLPQSTTEGLWSLAIMLVMLLPAVTLFVYLAVGWLGAGIFGIVSALMALATVRFVKWIEARGRRAYRATRDQLRSAGWNRTTLRLQLKEVAIPLEALRKDSRVIISVSAAMQLARDWREAREYLEARGSGVGFSPRLRCAELRLPPKLTIDHWGLDRERPDRFVATRVGREDAPTVGIPARFMELKVEMLEALGDVRLYWGREPTDPAPIVAPASRDSLALSNGSAAEVQDPMRLPDAHQSTESN